jgi:hypothetical protein
MTREFHKLVSFGPEYVCVSCRQVFFKHSVDEFKPLKVSNSLINRCVIQLKSAGNKEWICRQCKKYLKDGKVPPCSIGNGFYFPNIPFELQGLTQLEERLISPRIPFMLPRGGQLAVHGNVVNVPADVNKTVKPRNMDSFETEEKCKF